PRRLAGPGPPGAGRRRPATAAGAGRPGPGGGRTAAAGCRDAPRRLPARGRGRPALARRTAAPPRRLLAQLYAGGAPEGAEPAPADRGDPLPERLPGPTRPGLRPVEQPWHLAAPGGPPGGGGSGL